MFEDKPKVTLRKDQLKEAVLETYNRHLKRACGNKATAMDMTYHNLKHMGYDEADWEFMENMMMAMKEEINGK